MATENSEPKSGIIVRIGILGIVGVLATRFALIPFFDRAVDELQYERTGATASEDWQKLREADMKRLSDGPTSIEAAKATMVRKARSGLDEALVPHPSTDYAAIEGWSSEQWKSVPRTLPATFIPTDLNPASTSDGGVSDGGSVATDGAVHAALPPAAGKDAGATAPTPATPGHK